MKKLILTLSLALVAIAGHAQGKIDTSKHLYYSTNTHNLVWLRSDDPFKKADDLRDSISKYSEIVDWYKDQKDFTNMEIYKAKQQTYSNKLDTLIKSNRKAELEKKYKIKL